MFPLSNFEKNAEFLLLIPGPDFSVPSYLFSLPYFICILVFLATSQLFVGAQMIKFFSDIQNFLNLVKPHSLKRVLQNPH